MGVRLQSTAHSVNIKERLDFSCAVFDADGGLIANAPHMPVHLGSMGESIKMVIERNPRIRRGDVYVLNDPYHGGTHLPDITVVTPVCSPRQPRGHHGADDIWFYVASRGHHAEIGGVSPGIDAGRQHPGRGGGGADRQLAAGRERPAPRGRDDRAAARRPSTRPATRPPTWPTCAPRSPPTPRASPNCTAWWNISGWMSSRPTWATCSATPPRRSGASSPPWPTASSPTRWTTARWSGSRSGSTPRGRTAEIDFTGTSRPAGRELQRPVQRGHGGRALRLPHPGGRRHPAQLGLPGAADRDHPAGLHAVPAVPGRGRRGQRGDLPGRHRGAVRGAGRDGGGFGDDEQRDLRQRGVPVLRDGGQRLGGRATASTAPTWCRPR